MGSSGLCLQRDAEDTKGKRKADIIPCSAGLKGDSSRGGQREQLCSSGGGAETLWVSGWLLPLSYQKLSALPLPLALMSTMKMVNND